MASFHDDIDTGVGPEALRAHLWTWLIAVGGKVPDCAEYLPLLFPTILFLASLYIPPMIFIDSSAGFLALRSMLEGGAFNSVTAPDPANIANDVAIFLTWWSPGQYLVPGSFISLGTSYGFAVSLTALIATLTGVLGWIQVARSFAVGPFVLFIFVLGLNTFAYVTLSFRLYHGGELLLFAAAPWSLYAMRWSANKSPILCLTISLLSAALLFFAKLTGLIVFATNVVAISLLALANQRRMVSSTIAMLVASAIAALSFMIFWVARGPVPVGGSTFSFSWLPIWFSITGVALSGMSGLEFIQWLLRRYWVSSGYLIGVEPSYFLGPLGLLLLVWIWFRLRYTRYRETAALTLIIISLFAIVLASAMYVSSANISFEERHFRYAGILSFLLLLIAIDQGRARFAKGLACLLVTVLGLYGLKSSVTGAYAQMRTGFYDPMSGISQDMVSPAVLAYLRSEMIRQNLQRPIAVIPTPTAAISLPQFRIICPFGAWAGYTERTRWVGRADKIFVVLPEKMLLNGKVEAILRAFTDYDFKKWSQMKLGGMIIFTQ
jgi:hypothetical protein